MISLDKTVIELRGQFYDYESLPYDLTTLRVDEAYAFDGNVLIYKGELPKDKKSIVDKKGVFYTYENSNGKLDVKVYLDGDANSIERVIEVKDIFTKVMENPEQFVTPEDVEIISNNTEVDLPKINDNDDFLTKVIKKVIINKNVNLKNYDNKIEDEYILSNMIQSLKKKDQKMSVLLFTRWVNVLGLDYELTVRDNGNDKIGPMKEDVIYDSTQGLL